MSFPWYARSIVKYKSPHPQDLSFPKEQDLRVLGYADRGAEEEEAEEEDDRWYVGEWLDGSQQGQFPASLVVRIYPTEGDVPPAQVHPATEPIPEPKEVPVEDGTNEAPERVYKKTPMNAEQPSEEAPIEEAPRSAEQSQENVPVEEAPLQAEASSKLPIEQPMAQIYAEQAPQDLERIDPAPPKEVTDPVEEQGPAPIMPTTSEPVPESQEASATMPSHNPKDAPAEPVQEHAAPSVTTDSQSDEPSIDPSAMSLRDRIAAFNKPVEKGPPPPIPRGKPSSWKKPAPTHEAQEHVDAKTDATPNTFSASDAQSSIKMSLKERMAALQRNEEAIHRPALTTARQTPSKLTNPLPTDTPGEDAEHRASIARRMAALGGRRVEPGLFGVVPKAEAPKQTDEKDVDPKDASERDTCEKEMSQNSQATEAPTSDAPLAVPRRPVAPRTRRMKRAEEPIKGPENSEVHASTERQMPVSAEPAMDPLVSPVDAGASSVEAPATTRVGEECPGDVPVTHEEPREAPAPYNEQVSTQEAVEPSSETFVPGRDTTESCVPAQQEPLKVAPPVSTSTKTVQPCLEALSAPSKTIEDASLAPRTESVDAPTLEATEPQVSNTVAPPIREKLDVPFASEDDVYTGMETVPAGQPAIPDPTDPIEHITHAMTTMSTSDGATEDPDPDFAEQHALLEHLLQHPEEASCRKQDTASCSSERTSMAPPPIMGMPMPPRRSTNDSISPVSPMGYDTSPSYPTSPVDTDTAPPTRIPPRPTRRAPTLPVSEDTLASAPTQSSLSSNIVAVPISNSELQTEEATSPSSAAPDRPTRAPPRVPPVTFS